MNKSWVNQDWLKAPKELSQLLMNLNLGLFILTLYVMVVELSLLQVIDTNALSAMILTFVKNARQHLIILILSWKSSIPDKDLWKSLWWWETKMTQLRSTVKGIKWMDCLNWSSRESILLTSLSRDSICLSLSLKSLNRKRKRRKNIQLIPRRRQSLSLLLSRKCPRKLKIRRLSKLRPRKWKLLRRKSVQAKGPLVRLKRKRRLAKRSRRSSKAPTIFLRWWTWALPRHTSLLQSIPYTQKNNFWSSIYPNCDDDHQPLFQKSFKHI